MEGRTPEISAPSAAPWAVAWARHLNRFDAALHAASAAAIAKAAHAAGLRKPQGAETDKVETTPRTDGLTNLGTKDSPTKDKDLCFGNKLLQKACRNWARKVVLLRTKICALFTSRG